MARKGENIYKRKDGRWEGRYIKSRSSTGKANYGYVYAKSYREVKAKLISQSSCTSNSVTVDPEISSDQFEQVAMEWFQAICPKVKESTSNKYRNLLSSYILPVFGSKQLRDITHEFIETQCNFFLVSGGLKENGLSSKTVSDILSLIRNVLQFATRNGKAISCDARSIQIKRQTKETSVYKGYKQDKIEMRGDRAEMSDFPLYLNTVAGGLDRRDQTIGGFSFVVKIYAVPVVEIIG